MKVSYDGPGYPNLCSGQLKVELDGDVWVGDIMSGGSVWFTKDWDANVESGPWSVSMPDGFPQDKLDEVTEWVNSSVPWGCCGGCV